MMQENNSNKPLYNKVSLRNFETFHDVELFVIKGKINRHDATILVDNGCVPTTLCQKILPRKLV